MRDWWHRTPPWRPPLHGGIWRLPDPLPRLGGRERVLLTFDDGPSPSTLQMARLLESLGARAAFFLVGGLLPEGGESAEPRPREAVRITRELLQAGHLPCLHGLRHVRHAWRPPGAVARELGEAAGRIQQACGLAPPFFRPPYGSWSPWLSPLPRRAGLELMFWSYNPFDYRPRDPGELARLAGDGLRAGDILLLHCTGAGEEMTRAALPGLLERLRARGLEPLDPLCLLETSHE